MQPTRARRAASTAGARFFVPAWKSNAAPTPITSAGATAAAYCLHPQLLLRRSEREPDDVRLPGANRSRSPRRSTGSGRRRAGRACRRSRRPGNCVRMPLLRAARASGPSSPRSTWRSPDSRPRSSTSEHQVGAADTLGRARLRACAAATRRERRRETRARRRRGTVHVGLILRRHQDVDVAEHRVAARAVTARARRHGRLRRRGSPRSSARRSRPTSGRAAAVGELDRCAHPTCRRRRSTGIVRNISFTSFQSDQPVT